MSAAVLSPVAARFVLPAALEPLRQRKAWVLWRHEPRDGRRAKVPYMSPGKRAASDDPATWARYDELPSAAGFDGPGIMLGGALQGVDLDACLGPDGEIEEWAREVVERIDSYTETSPSGRGLKLFFYGPAGESRSVQFGEPVEIAPGESKRRELAFFTRRRFFTITGGVWRDRPLRAISSDDARWLRDHIEQLREAERDRRNPRKVVAAPKSTPARSHRAVVHHSLPDKLLMLIRENAPVGERSERFHHAVRWAADIGLDAEQIVAVLEAHPDGVAAKYAGRVRAEVERSLAGYVPRHSGRVQALARDGAADERDAQRRAAQAIGDGAHEAQPIAELMSLEQMLAELVFVADGARVAKRSNPGVALPFGEFRLHTRASVARLGQRMVPVADLWVQNPGRITVHTMTFRPGHPEFTFDPEGASALNLWRPRQRVPSTASAQPFLDHIEYLVPESDERERFLNWLAHIEQRPGELPHTHYLMVTRETGIGRNWLASLLARVWAGATRLGFDLVGAMNSGFNGPLSRRLLVVVDELKAADTNYSAANHAQQLKAMLTTEHRCINPKFGRQHIEFNCARWLMFSQHFDALPLERADRRVVVIANPVQRKPAEYYKRLYGLLGDESFVAAVAQYLAGRDISGFNPNEPAPMTAAKKEAVEACTPDVEKALIALRDSTTARVMTAADIAEYLNDCGLRPPPGRGMSSAYAAAGLVPCAKLVTHKGRRHRVVALRDGDTLRTASSAHLAAELAQAERGAS